MGKGSIKEVFFFIENKSIQYLHLDIVRCVWSVVVVTVGQAKWFGLAAECNTSATLDQC